MSEKQRFQAGFARVDISPEESVPLAGYGNTSNRMSQTVMDPLYANCLAVTDEDGSTAVIMVLDLGNMYNPLPDIRAEVSRTLGLPMERVMICCTHTHSAPHLSNGEKDSIPRYNEKLRRCMAEAALAALADRKPAQMQAASIQTAGLNFVRRYVLEDGTYAGDNYGHFKESPIARHETEADHQLQLIKFVREGGKDIVAANFQGHPHRAGGSKKYEVTSDLVGVFRRTLEDSLSCHAMYFTGASGNVNCHSRIPEENITPNYIEHGKALAKYALEAAFAPVKTGKIRNIQVMYEGKTNHTEDHLLSVAEEIKKVWTATGDGKECIRMGAPYGINSPYHALSIINKSTLPETITVELNAVSLGDTALVFAPFELFDTLGMRIKENSPFDTTFVCCYANRVFSYMPTKLGFEHGGYGPNQCKFLPGTGEMLAEQFLKMLDGLRDSE